MPARRAAEPNPGPPVGGLTRFVRDLGGALSWQLAAKLIQIVGAGYAYRCLGPEHVGLSGTVLVAALFGQLLFDFGLEIVSVRHIAARTESVEAIARAVFSLRLLIAGCATVIWIVAVLFTPLSAAERWVWALGAPHLMFLTLNFGWYFQATHRVPRFSLIQSVNSAATSVWFLAFFRPGQAVGSDLLVMLVVNAVITVSVWWWIKRQLRIRLLALSSLKLALRLFVEGRPNWAFNLSYYLLSAMGLPLCFFLLDEEQAGHFRAAAMLAAAAQMFLAYFAYMMNPRIVAWRHEQPDAFAARVFQLVAAVFGAGLVALAVVWLLRRPVILLIYSDTFLPAAGVLPLLVWAKFVAVSSGILVWALFAGQKDWWTVLCCWPALVLEAVLHWYLLPRFGMVAAGWLNAGAEVLLFIACLFSFSVFARTLKSRDEKPD